jgi:hypothetical protein
MAAANKISLTPAQKRETKLWLVTGTMARLPDGVFSNPKIQNLGKFWRALEWKMLVYFMAIWNILLPFGVFYGHLEYVMAIWYFLWPFGNFVYFSPFGYFVSRKIWQPWARR